MNLPLGYSYAATYAGIRQVEKNDLALIVSGLRRANKLVIGLAPIGLCAIAAQTVSPREQVHSACRCCGPGA